MGADLKIFSSSGGVGGGVTIEPFCVVGVHRSLVLSFTDVLLIVFSHHLVLESVGTLATAIRTEVGTQNVSGPREVASDAVANLSCVADSTVVDDVADEAILEPVSGSDTEGEMSGLDDEDTDSNDVISNDNGSPDPPILRGRLVRLSDYLPAEEMPNISFSNPANFWFLSN